MACFKDEVHTFCDTKQNCKTKIQKVIFPLKHIWINNTNNLLKLFQEIDRKNNLWWKYIYIYAIQIAAEIAL